MLTPTATIENSLGVPQKFKNRVTLWPNSLSSEYLPEKLENIYLQRYVLSYVHCSTIHSGQDMETTEVSFDRWLGKDVVHVIYT